MTASPSFFDPRSPWKNGAFLLNKEIVRKKTRIVFFSNLRVSSDFLWWSEISPTPLFFPVASTDQSYRPPSPLLSVFSSSFLSCLFSLLLLHHTSSLFSYPPYALSSQTIFFQNLSFLSFIPSPIILPFPSLSPLSLTSFFSTFRQDLIFRRSIRFAEYLIWEKFLSFSYWLYLSLHNILLYINFIFTFYLLNQYYI